MARSFGNITILKCDIGPQCTWQLREIFRSDRGFEAAVTLLSCRLRLGYAILDVFTNANVKLNERGPKRDSNLKARWE